METMTIRSDSSASTRAEPADHREMAAIAPRPSWTVLPAVDSWNEPPASVLEYLTVKFPRISPSTWLDRMRRGLVIDRDGRPLDPTAPYRAHQRVGYFRELKREEVNPHQEKILFQSDRLLVVDKPPFLPVTPSGRFVNECLIYRVERRLGLEGIAPIHRLDRMTSGLVLLSSCPSARAAYGSLFEQNAVTKTYQAWCSAPQKPATDSWTVESVIEKGDPWFRMRSRPSAGPGDPANSKTLVRLLDWQDGVGHFEMRPVTGKTHQLRVHMASLGFPILRDPLYPKLKDKAPDNFQAPMALWAGALSFKDPFSGGHVRFQSTLDLLTLGFADPR